MGTKGSEEKATTNPKLRRKMLERWENEGGKIGEIETKAEPDRTPTMIDLRKRHSKHRPRKSK